jgi:sterol desaturase/sphingolipid hydroxylase (fatty acid hydroxylase superfamily)
MAINGYSYPFSGIIYLLKKKELRKNSYLPVFFSLVIDIVVLIVMFNFLNTPQYNLINERILPFFWPWLNHVINFIIIILEIFIISQIVINVFLGYFHEKAFDEVLVLQGCQYLLQQEESNCMKSIMRSIRLFQLIKILVANFTLPLNFIPTLGTIAYYFFNGVIQGWDHQDRYFELKKIDSTSDQWQFIKAHFKNMCTFGIAAFFLESLPIIGNIFNITNAVGIALYDCHLEKKNGALDGKNSDDENETFGDDINQDTQPSPTQQLNYKNIQNYGSNGHNGKMN